jgi:hypothetical protein
VEIEMWDDRIEHHETFAKWGEAQNITVTINLVKR